jgi:N-acetyl-beta-hexosaminidase
VVDSGALVTDDITDAVVTLKDGRALHVAVMLESPETFLQVRHFDAAPAVVPGELVITLDSSNDITLNWTLRFLRSESECPPA